MRVVVVFGVSSSEAAVGRGFGYIDIYLDAMCLMRVSMIALDMYILNTASPSELGAPSSMPVLRPLGIASELGHVPSELGQGKVMML